jgi:formylglycine-generating enzyme required for sulfatase activity
MPTRQTKLTALIILSAAFVQAGFVTIGGIGVAADTNGYGGVNYTYGISQYEVTGAEFATAAAADNRIGDCTSSSPNAPAEYVSWYEAAMYCNWLTSGNAYSGAYQFDGSGNYLGVNRAAAISSYGIIYALPTEDEWYKAAYWTGNVSDPWSLYANGTDTFPTWGTTAGWNYYNGSQYAYGGTTWEIGYGAQEQNGTYDMMGNVWEWTETYHSESERVLRGGSAEFEQGMDSGASYLWNTASDNQPFLGFRVAMIPEPSTVLLFGLGGLGAWLLRRNKLKSREDAE